MVTWEELFGRSADLGRPVHSEGDVRLGSPPDRAEARSFPYSFWGAVEV